MGELLGLASALSFGISSIFIGRAVVKIEKKDRDLGVLITIVINTILSTLAMIIYFFAVGPVSWNASGIIFFMLVGVFSSFLGRTLFFEGITHIGPARSSTIKLFGPVFTIFIGVVFLNERLSILSWSGLALILAGLFVIAWETVRKEEKKTAVEPDMFDIELEKNSENNSFWGRNARGVALGLLAGASYGTATVFRKMGMQILPNAFLGTWLGFLTSITLYFLFMCRRYGFGQLIDLLRRSIHPEYFYSGIFTTAAQFLILLSLKFIGVGIANTLLNTDAVFTTVMGYFILKNRERISIYTVIGVLLVTVGVSILILGKT